MDDKMKTLFNKIKIENKTINKNFDKIEELKIELVKIKNSNNLNKLQYELKELNKFQVNDKNLHEIKTETLLNYVGEFEKVGSLKIGDQIRQTHIRFRIITDYEAYINSINERYDAEDTNFNDYFHKINTPQFIKVNRSQYGNARDFRHEVIECQGNNCFIPTKGYCFVKCVNFLTGGDYRQQNLEYIRNEKRGSNIMTKARIQPFCRANNINLVCFDGTKVFPRSVTDRDNALFFYNNLFCLIWKSEGVSFILTIEELNDNFKIVDNFIYEENLSSHFKFEFGPKKIDSHLTNSIVYDLETHNTDRARPYCISF